MNNEKKQADLTPFFATMVYVVGVTMVHLFMKKAYGAMSVVASTKGPLGKTPSNPTWMFFVLHLALIILVSLIVVFE